jgi:heme-degrading monooxygenase HmoA
MRRNGSTPATVLAQMAHMYIRVWEYTVGADLIDAFIAAYGPEGDWARLFRGGRGHVSTELYRSTSDEAQFVTVDRWTDEAAWRDFLEERGETYRRLDTAMSALIASQHSLLEGTS